MNVTEFTSNLKRMCFTGKKTERRCLCEQHTFVFTGKVVPVILLVLLCERGYWWAALHVKAEIHPSPGVRLTGDLTNHNAESTILSDKQISQESRLTSVDLNLKNCLLTSFRLK